MRIRNAVAVISMVAMLGCGLGEGIPGEQEAGATGRVELPLTATGTDGVAYKLVGATVSISGPKSVVVTDTAIDLVTLVLPEGTYQATLGGAWQLERADTPGQPVGALLVSPNPLTFTVQSGATTLAQFLFKLRNGTANVGVSVAQGGWVRGTFTLTAVDDPGATGLFQGLLNTPLSFTIAFDTPTFSTTTSTSVAGTSITTSMNLTPATAQFGGTADAVLQAMATAFQGSLFGFSLTDEGYGQIRLGGIGLAGDQRGSAFAFQAGFASLFAGTLDPTGAVAPKPFSLSGVPFRLWGHGNAPSLQESTATGTGDIEVVFQ